MDDNERERLILTMRPFILNRAEKFYKKFHPPYWDRDDFVSIGWQAAVTAADSFKPEVERERYEDRRALFVSYATKRIVGAMQDVIRDNKRKSFLLRTKQKNIPVKQRDNELQNEDLKAAIKRYLSPSEYRLFVDHYFDERTFKKLAPGYGVSPSRLSQRWGEITRKLKTIPELKRYLTDE
ncbi:MAG: sigma-70 family RNA polymerase sigma factor [Thermoguttaceae bacterium]|nr:sigma-70 family RNA polymerase sigma factor [Thermoguttaceae bacterium]